MDHAWYEKLFHGIALDLWRKAIPPEQTCAEASFLEGALNLQPGARVPDVPCGSGRHSIELASRGFRMTGVDLSSEQIQEAGKATAAAGSSVEWRLADMRALPWRSEFDAAFCFGNSFGYLDPGGTREFLSAVSRVLKPGARFTMDTGLAAECILSHLQEREWSRVDDILFLEENRYHVMEGCIETAYTFVRGGEITTRTGLQWVHTVREIRQFLLEAGFRIKHLYASLDKKIFQVGSRYLIVVAERT